MPPAAASTTPILAAQVARLFFDRQLSKVEIGSRLGISRFRVARLIESALADGLVKIEFRDIPTDDRDLSAAMEARFGLDLCAVAAVPADDAAGDQALVSVARLAGAVIDGLITPGDVIGIAWGSTLAAVVREIPTRNDHDLEVVQLAGSSARLRRERDSGELARVLADRLGATRHAIYAPAFVETADLRRSLQREPEVADAVARFGALTLAIVGIGAMAADDGSPASSLLRSGVLDDDEVARLSTLGAVGDLVVHPFDARGGFVDAGLADRALAIGVEELRQVGRVLAVASGVRKADAIRGALATGLVRMLVTDGPTARAILAGA